MCLSTFLWIHLSGICCGVWSFRILYKCSSNIFQYGYTENYWNTCIFSCENSCSFDVCMLTCWRKTETVHAKWSCRFHSSQLNFTMFSWQHLLITKGCAHEVGSDSTLMMSFSMTSQHSGGQTTVHTISSVYDHLAHRHIPDTDTSLLPPSWYGMLMGFLAKLLAGLRQVLAACQLVWSLSQPSVHFVPHLLDWPQIGGHRGPSHHQHILMTEKIHDETRNA